MDTKLVALGLSLCVGAASAQTVNVSIEVDEPLLAPGSSTDVRLVADFDTFDYAVAGIDTNLLALAPADLSGVWSNIQLVPPMNGPGTVAGVPDGTGSILGILAGQLHFPAAGIFAFPQNPITIWSATFTAPDEGVGGGGYWVDLSTSSERLWMYPDRETSRSESRIEALVEGQGRIFVVPAPSNAWLLALGLIGTCRRRRPA